MMGSQGLFKVMKPCLESACKDIMLFHNKGSIEFDFFDISDSRTKSLVIGAIWR